MVRRPGTTGMSRLVTLLHQGSISKGLAYSGAGHATIANPR